MLCWLVVLRATVICPPQMFCKPPRPTATRSLTDRPHLTPVSGPPKLRMNAQYPDAAQPHESLLTLYAFPVISSECPVGNARLQCVTAFPVFVQREEKHCSTICMQKRATYTGQEFNRKEHSRLHQTFKRVHQTCKKMTTIRNTHVSPPFPAALRQRDRGGRCRQKRLN